MYYKLSNFYYKKFKNDFLVDSPRTQIKKIYIQQIKPIWGLLKTSQVRFDLTK